jgi:DNA-binding transcriptional LysR family regulator
VPDHFVVAFVIGVTPNKWARVWNERMPHLRLELQPMTRGEAVTGLADGSVHAAFLRDHESAQAIRLYEELPVVVAPKDHAVTAFDTLTATDLADEVVLAYDEDSAASVAELVGANVGVAIMPQSVARAVSRKDVVARPFEGATTEVSLVWTEKTDAVEELIGIVRGRTANSSRAATEAPAKKLSASQKGAAKRARAAAAKAPTKKKR